MNITKKNPLVIIAIIFALLGIAQLSNATLGVGLICFGCFIAILARLVQASIQHDQILKETDIK